MVQTLVLKSFGTGRMRKTNQWLIREEKSKSRHAKEQMMRFFSPIVLCFFLAFFLCMVDKFLWSVVLLLLYEAHARRTPVRYPTTFISLFFFFSFFLVWGFDWKMQVKVYDTKYVTVCTYWLLSVCHSLTLASDRSRKRFTKILTAEVTCGQWRTLLKKDM